MWTKLICCLCGLFLILINQVTYAQNCEANAIQLKPISGQPDYDVLAGGHYALTMSYTIGAQISGENCQIRIRLRLDEGGQSLHRQSNGNLEFEWYGNGGYSLGDSWITTLSSLKPQSSVALRFRSRQWLLAGLYSGQLIATIDNSEQTNIANALPETLNIHVNVLPVAQIQFYGMTQQHIDFDMGTLTSGKYISGAPRLWVQSNTGYTIRVASSHQGRLRHQSNNEKWDIFYQMLLDNTHLDITQPSADIVYDSFSAGHIIPLSFVIEDTELRPAGLYSDILHLSVEPDLTIQP